MTNTQNKPSGIPKYFIFRNDGSAAFEKCLDWWNKKYYKYALGTMCWYGFGDIPMSGSYPEDFANNPTCFEPAELWALIQQEENSVEPVQTETDEVETLRDKFAMAYTPNPEHVSLIAEHNYGDQTNRNLWRVEAEMRYCFADAMMEARKKKAQ